MTAVIYDKWLHSMGGGEVVACSIAKILKDEGYDVLFISGKEVSPEKIFNKLKIDLKGIKFTQVWNDETAIKKLTKKKDLFINLSFMDYSKGFAKRNFYYTHFPTKPYNGLEGIFFTKVIIPIISKLIRPIESMSIIDAPAVMNGLPAFALRTNNRFAISVNKIETIQLIEFKLFFENFHQTALDTFTLKMENGEIIEQKVNVSHGSNTLKFSLKIRPFTKTIYLILSFYRKNVHGLEEDKIYLLYPKINLKSLPIKFFDNLIQRISVRLRAGIFMNVLERLKTYQIILVNSKFSKKWVENYWQRESQILYPPVTLISRRNNSIKRKKWICSVGRFFTLGHGKKQEIMIDAFKQLCAKSSTKWELHLVGGLGTEPSSLIFFNYLKEKALGYPIYFHTNISRRELEKIYLSSEIYWHAAGFGEDKNILPIKFEHFGIAPIEAISASCIPILFNGGGLKEIVSILGLSEKNLFASVKELVENTLFFDNQRDLIDWKKIHAKVEKNFSYKAFVQRFSEVLKD